MRKGALKKEIGALKKEMGALSGHLSFWVSGVESPLIFLYKKNKKKISKKLHDQNTSLSLIE